MSSSPSDRASPAAAIGVFVIPVTPFQQNCTVVWCQKTRRAAIIDPGDSAAEILAEVRRRGLEPEKIWVTHGHIDHAGAVADMKDISGLPVEGPHPEDQFWIEGLSQQGAAYGMLQARAFTPDRWLGDDERVTVGETEWEVYHTPGHTPGHVIFFHRPSRFAQVGDVLFRGSIGRTDFPRGDLRTLMRSVVTRLWPLGDDVTFVPGHGPQSTLGEERRTNPFVSDAVLRAQGIEFGGEQA